MAVPVFAPSIGPSTQNTSRTVAARTLTAALGDGYQQVTSDGINNLRATWTLEWDGMSKAEMQAIDAFFVAQAGYLVFQWTAPGDTAPKLWRCAQFGSQPTGPQSWTYTATLIQQFDITSLS